MTLLRIGAVVWLALTPGCAAWPSANPAFSLSVKEAKSALREMAADPKPLERPLVILGGIHDPGFAASNLAAELRRILPDGSPIVTVPFLTTTSFDESCRRAVDAVERQWPSGDPTRTIEVDVIGVSMGGLVARASAREHPDRPRLSIHRLWTVATPHLGAQMADLPTWDDRVVDMRHGSAFLAVLNEHTRSEDPPIVAYTRLDDVVVGPEFTAPPGMSPLWVENRPFAFAHLTASRDPRIIADIARRLRGETPFTLPDLAQQPPG